MVLGYKMLVRFLDTPQFSGFHKPNKKNSNVVSGGGGDGDDDDDDDTKITCFNQSQYMIFFADDILFSLIPRLIVINFS